MIGGNIVATIQLNKTDGKNAIGEGIVNWLNVAQINGWLDFISGEAKYNTFNAKIEESSHVFICDYTKDLEKLYYLLDGSGDYIFDVNNCTIRTATGDEVADKVTSENSRMIIKEQVYDIVYIDNPMELNQHFEFYLKLVGRYEC